MRTHKRLIDIIAQTPKTGDRLMRLEPASRRRHRDQAMSTHRNDQQIKGVRAQARH